MKLKSYFAATVDAAMTLARQELGPDALLVQSRRATADAGRLGDYEVVFASEADDRPAAGAREAAGECGSPAAAMPDGWQMVLDEMAGLRRQVERAAAVMTRTAALAAAPGAGSPDLAAIFSALLAADLSTELAQKVVGRLQVWAANASRPPDLEDLEAPLAAGLQALFDVDPGLGRPGSRRRVTALVGPPGAGKTTTLVKLAARYGLTSRRGAQILSMDRIRVGAADQLRSFAAILDIGFQALETPRALAQALEEHRNKELILIDTPGTGGAQADQDFELADFLAGHPEVETQLVLTATTKTADLFRAVARLEIFRPARLIFTRCDETESWGSIINVAERTGKALSFLSNGQQIPEDLQPATKDGIVLPVLGGRLNLPQCGALASAAAA